MLSPYFVHPKKLNLNSSFRFPFISNMCIPIAVLMNIYYHHQYTCLSRREWYPKTSLCNHLATRYDVTAPGGYIHTFLGVVLARHLSTLARIINNLCKPGTTALTTLRTCLWENEHASVCVGVCAWAWAWACVCVWKRAGKRVCVCVCVSVCVRLKENEQAIVCVWERVSVSAWEIEFGVRLYASVCVYVGGWQGKEKENTKTRENGIAVQWSTSPMKETY